MRQSTIIFGSLIVAFIIYITVRGQLPAYFGLFTGAPNGRGAGSPDKGEPDAPKDPWSLDSLLNGLGVSGGFL